MSRQATIAKVRHCAVNLCAKWVGNSPEAVGDKKNDLPKEAILNVQVSDGQATDVTLR
jgi:hypothetical protein